MPAEKTPVSVLRKQIVCCAVGIALGIVLSKMEHAIEYVYRVSVDGRVVPVVQLGY